jgi:hypothetical protein
MQVMAVEKEKIPGKNQVAELLTGPYGLSWNPLVEYSKLELTVSLPDGHVVKKVFDAGATPGFDLADGDGKPVLDGSYTYQLRVIPFFQRKNPNRDGKQSSTSQMPAPNTWKHALTQSGAFYVRAGRIVPSNIPEQQLSGTKDQVILDDLIVDGSICAGMDCVNGESFGFDTIRLKENNLRIRFVDTSSTSSFPSRDWQITVNDSANGGQNKFSIDDIDGGRTPFTIEAGAPSHSLYVDDGGRLGLGTSTPVTDAHIKTGNTPTLRLEQDGSSGFTPQTWDVASNEANFFIRDATNGSTLPFRIQPGAPSSSLSVMSDGKIGIGTWSPSYPVHLLTDSSTPALVIAERGGGATVQFSAGASDTFFGSRSNDPLNLLVNQQTMMYIDTSGNVAIKNADTSITAGRKIDTDTGGYLTSGGVWQGTSTRTSKENIEDLATEEAIDAFEKLNPVKFNYKKEKGEQYIGFIAEDVPELVVNKDRNAMNAMDVVAVLTKVVQEQQKNLKAQQKAMKEQRETISQLSKKVAELEKKSK